MLVDSIRAFESPVRIERDVCRTMSEALSNDLWMFAGYETCARVAHLWRKSWRRNRGSGANGYSRL